jgi:hypothetical protein
MADYLSVNDLVFALNKHISDSYRPVVEALQQGVSSLPADFLKQFISGVKMAFGDEASPNKSLQQVFVRFVTNTRYRVLYDNNFRQALVDVPEFAVAILQKGFGDDGRLIRLDMRT